MAAARTATAKGEGTVAATKRYENIGYCRRWAAVCVERVRIREQDGGDVGSRGLVGRTERPVGIPCYVMCATVDS